jgi:hypothetical protein
MHDQMTFIYGCKGENKELLHQQRGYVNHDELLTAYEEWAEENGYTDIKMEVKNEERRSVC